MPGRPTASGGPGLRGSATEPTRPAATTSDPHWFYDSRITVAVFCLSCLAAIFWQVSVFEGFQPVFRCATWTAMDPVILQEGMDACMADAHGREDQERCMRTVHILACMKEVWR